MPPLDPVAAAPDPALRSDPEPPPAAPVRPSDPAAHHPAPAHHPTPTHHPAPAPTTPPGPPPFWAYTPPGQQLPPSPLPTRGRWHRTRRACLVLAVVGLLVVAGAVAVGVRAYLAARTPQAAAAAYLGAVARGDAAAALAAGVVPAGGRALVTDDVLRATLALAPMTDISTGTVSRNGDAATVAVRYRLGGATPQEVDDAIDLRRVDGRWQLVRSAVPVSLTVTDAASWAAVPAATPFAVPDDVQLVLPGAVPVTYRTPALQVAPQSRVVRLAGGEDTVRITAAVTGAGRESVVRALVAALTACARGGTDVDPYCPQPAPGRAEGVVLRSVPQSFAGTLLDADRLDPDLEVTPDTAGTLDVSGSVDAKGDWQVLDYDNVAQDRTGTTSITFDATVALAATGVVVWDRS